MANLLPSESLRSVRSLNRARFLLVGSLVSIACGGIALLALLPLYAMVRGDEPVQSEGANSSQSLTALSGTDRQDIVRSQTLLRSLREVVSASSSALEILDVALRARPKGVLVSGITYVRGDPGTITLSGEAPSRDTVNAYRSALAADQHFKTVSVPLGILTGSEEGRFTITLTGTF